MFSSLNSVMMPKATTEILLKFSQQIKCKWFIQAVIRNNLQLHFSSAVSTAYVMSTEISGFPLSL